MDQDQFHEIRDEKSGEIRFELEIESLPFSNSPVDQPSETLDDQNISLSPSKSRDKLIARWLRTLTRPQLQAINLVYLKNYDRLSQRAVAEKIGISLDSLVHHPCATCGPVFKNPSYRRTHPSAVTWRYDSGEFFAL